MNPFEMVVLIVAIVTLGSVIRGKGAHRRMRDRIGDETETQVENQRLLHEIAAMKDRIKVLERIAVDKEDTLARQIDDLRDR